MKRNSSEEKGDAWLRHILTLAGVEGATHLLTRIEVSQPTLARRAWSKELLDRIRMRPVSERWTPGGQVTILQVPCQMGKNKAIMFWAPGVGEWVPGAQKWSLGVNRKPVEGLQMIYPVTASRLSWQFSGSSPVGYMQRDGWQHDLPKTMSDLPTGSILVNNQPLGLQLVMRKGAAPVKTIPALPWEPQVESDEVALDPSLVDLSNVSRVDLEGGWWWHNTPWEPLAEIEEAVEEAMDS